MKLLFASVATAAMCVAQTGVAVPELADLDRGIQALMEYAGVPGGAVAIAKDGRLVFARGYGVADVSTSEAVQPDSLFRIGSISKTVTAAAVLKLVEQGRIALDARAYAEVLTQTRPFAGAKVDPRTWSITVRQLLQHTGGHGRDTGVDPLNAVAVIDAAKAAGTAAPAARDDLVRYAMGLPLDFDPGAKFSYSNYGYLVLARVVERAGGMAYDEFVRREVLAPMGIRRMALGRGSPEYRLPGEAHYYETPRTILEPSIIPGLRRLLPRPYANFEELAADGCGRWVGSAVDLVRFAGAMERSRSFELVTERPQPFVSQNASNWYGLGAVVDGRTWWHNGAYPGSLAEFRSLGNGVIYAIAFNAWPQDYAKFLLDASALLSDFCARQQRWPPHDLFPAYYQEN